MAENETETVETQATETEAIETQETQTTETGGSAEERLARMEAAIKKANAEAAKYRKKAQAFEEAEQKRKEAEMSEADKLKARAEKAEAEAALLKHQGLQREIAERVGLPSALALRLHGETAEEMEADAKSLLESLPKAEKPKPSTTATNPGAGHQGAETDEQKRARLFGVQVDPFAEDVLRQKGGGVYFIKEE